MYSDVLTLTRSWFVFVLKNTAYSILEFCVHTWACRLGVRVINTNDTNLKSNHRYFLRVSNASSRQKQQECHIGKLLKQKRCVFLLAVGLLCPFKKVYRCHKETDSKVSNSVTEGAKCCKLLVKPWQHQPNRSVLQKCSAARQAMAATAQWCFHTLTDVHSIKV